MWTPNCIDEAAVKAESPSDSSFNYNCLKKICGENNKKKRNCNEIVYAKPVDRFVKSWPNIAGLVLTAVAGSHQFNNDWVQSNKNMKKNGAKKVQNFVKCDSHCRRVFCQQGKVNCFLILLSVLIWFA